MVGGSLSWTVILKKHVATFRYRSVTIYFKATIPSGKYAGGKYWLGEYNADAIPVSLLMKGMGHETSAVPLPTSVVTVWETGQFTEGGVVKVMTVNVNEQLASLPEVSTAEATTW
jgi:hypothetical protein